MSHKLLRVGVACAVAFVFEVLANQHESSLFAPTRSAPGVVAVIAAEGVFLGEAHTVCGAGFRLYTKRRTLTPQELAWLRQLLQYLFNGTTFIGIELEEAMSRDATTGLPRPDPEAKLQTLLDEPAFAKWMGKELSQSLLEVRRARAALTSLSSSNAPPINPELEMQRLPVRRYLSVSDGFYQRLQKKFGLEAVRLPVDCD
jgi:hypothetical protein